MVRRVEPRWPGSERSQARSPALVVMVVLTSVAAVVALVVVLNDGSSGQAPSSSTTGAHVEGQATARGSRTPTPTARSTSPSGTRPSAAPSTPSARSSGTARGSTPNKPAPPLTYVVHRGDNLTVIAKWFHLHGYGALYERNRAVIGDDPNLIFPGQRITVSGAGMTVGGH